ncbi:MAG: HAMP domain-containing histidine kinase [Gammaproteobacteria bacterium]|nr:HAMP domain-containing histidine kinase [Gammaproteobacteria bacterium]MBU1775715.1 HAMP domain-containing histidine kinase [Gammaproteobacteria bacterium]MBU1969976.1 HAMP domain-containing histidine kinase [Gammaproteobacteria bacterium]
MLHLKDVSLDYKIPLRVTALVIVTASVLASVLVYRSTEDLRQNLIASATRVGGLVADTLIEPILHDDVWRAFEVVNLPFRSPSLQATDQSAEYLLVLDRNNQIYVSNRPDLFPMMQHPAISDPALASYLTLHPQKWPEDLQVIDSPASNALFLLVPIKSDGIRIGTLIMNYSKTPFSARLRSLARDAILITLLVLTALLPLGVYWGRRMAEPLLQLSDAMNRIGPHLPEPEEIKLEESRDEIGMLAKSFKAMLGELKEKEQLQQQVITSDRLAALGRLAAGVAHEINNPLGGMLNAVSTFKRHGEQDPLTLKTLSILERGLLQIKETVAALLVEAKAQTRPFDLNDVADICTLVQPDTEKKHIDFTHEVDILEAQPISSTLVRQVIINLLLNAFQATQPHGHVRLRIFRDSEHLFIDVINDGSHIPQDKVSYLFEPFTSLREEGNGLGLWVIYQIVQQLGGLITVQSEPDHTQFTVQLPLDKTHEQTIATHPLPD